MLCALEFLKVIDHRELSTLKHRPRVTLPDLPKWCRLIRNDSINMRTPSRHSTERRIHQQGNFGIRMKSTNIAQYVIGLDDIAKCAMFDDENFLVLDMSGSLNSGRKLPGK
jgi:hypothetical protein